MWGSGGCWDGGSGISEFDTHVSGHGGDEDDAASALGDHVSRSLPSGEEGPVNVDIIQTLDAVEGVADECSPRDQ